MVGLASFLVVLSSVLAPASLGNPQQLPGLRPITTDLYSQTHELLRALYPELIGREFTIDVRGDREIPFDSVPLPLLSFALTIGPPTRSDLASKPLIAFVSYTPEQLLWELTVDGSLVNGAKTAQLVEFVETHQDASEIEIDAKLTSLGARFGREQGNAMREEARRQCARIARLLGSIELGRIRLFDDGTNWIVDAVISTPRGPQKYVMLFEPFDGRLVRLEGKNKDAND